MDYERLLNGYKSLPIKVYGYPTYLKRDDVPDAILRTLNSDLASLLNAFDLSNNEGRTVSIIKITPKGLFFDLKNLKKVLLEYFGILYDDELPNFLSGRNIYNKDFLMKELNRINKEINENVIKEPNLSHTMKWCYSRYELQRYMPKNAKKSTIEKAKRKEFMEHLKRQIGLVRDLYVNEKKYSSVNDIFDQDKVNLYLAYLIMNYARTSKEKNEMDNFKIALKYLNDYIDNNSELVRNKYSIKFEFCVAGKFIAAWSEYGGKKKPYKISTIVEYVEKYKPKQDKRKNELKENNIEKYNYSFFECDDMVKSRELLGKYFKCGQGKDNSEELKKQLERKIKLYESINYTKLKIGVDSFEGYIGFQLDNGYVILDKFYDDIEKGRIAKDNAIYIVKEEEFEKITRMTKTQAIEAINSGLIIADRKVHNGNYEEKIKKYLK